jgi:hypothetical protein
MVMNIKDFGKKTKGRGAWVNASITMILITLAIGSKTKGTDMVPSSTNTTKSDISETGGMTCATEREF